jgi:hypothetical protein
VNGIFRRKSGIYFARLAVPAALRAAVGKRELIASTGLRDLTLAKVVAGAIVSGWRRHWTATLRTDTTCRCRAICQLRQFKHLLLVCCASAQRTTSF